MLCCQLEEPTREHLHRALATMVAFAPPLLLLMLLILLLVLVVVVLLLLLVVVTVRTTRTRTRTRGMIIPDRSTSSASIICRAYLGSS
jgi:hypothetical protein